MTPGLERLRRAQRLADVAAPDRARQAVRRRVGEPERLLLRVEGMIETTGPKISSRAMRMSFETPSKTVGIR
jgi:hypothetical protein